MESAFPRALTPVERGILDFLLAADFQGVRELREQAKTAVVTGLCDCGCPSFNLAVDASCAAADAVHLPVEARGRKTGDDYVELLLFVVDGLLVGIELLFYGEPPRELPSLDAFDAPIVRTA